MQMSENVIEQSQSIIATWCAISFKKVFSDFLTIKLGIFMLIIKMNCRKAPIIYKTST